MLPWQARGLSGKEVASSRLLGSAPSGLPPLSLPSVSCQGLTQQLRLAKLSSYISHGGAGVGDDATSPGVSCFLSVVFLLLFGATVSCGSRMACDVGHSTGSCPLPYMSRVSATSLS